MARSTRIIRRKVTGGLAALCCAGVTLAAAPASAVTPADWPAFLDGPAHTSYSAGQTAITPANAATLTQKWQFNIGFASSPVVADGSIFIGSFSGFFYKINALNGVKQQKRFLGFQPKHTCPAFGFASTATVALDPSTGQDTVYVAAPDGFLYALNAATFAQKWRVRVVRPSSTVSNYFQWSSPTVANGKIYVGISSNCDIPMVRGGEVAFSQVSGRKLAEFDTVPKGAVGGSIWSSAAVDKTGNVYVTTGNYKPNAKNLYHTVSMLKLSPALKLLASFQVPKAERTGDGDFGGSATLFKATVGGKSAAMVGACNKNGIYYALRQSNMAKVWQKRIGAKSSSQVEAQCQSAAAFDGSHLFMAGPATTVKGVTRRGSVEELNPATGATVWQTGLPNGVLTSPTLDGSGVLGVGTYDNGTAPNATYLLNASTGAILKTTGKGAVDFPQSVFANGWVFTANNLSLSAWGP